MRVQLHVRTHEFCNRLLQLSSKLSRSAASTPACREVVTVNYSHKTA